MYVCLCMCVYVCVLSGRAYGDLTYASVYVWCVYVCVLSGRAYGDTTYASVYVCVCMYGVYMYVCRPVGRMKTLSKSQRIVSGKKKKVCICRACCPVWRTKMCLFVLTCRHIKRIRQREASGPSQSAKKILPKKIPNENKILPTCQQIRQKEAPRPSQS